MPATQEVRREKPKPRPHEAHLPKPKGKGTPVDRAQCPSCWSMRPVETVDGKVVFATHVVWVKDENHPRGGEHQACPGSGTRPDRVVHSAEIAINARRVTP